jgi:hypothetical protein
VLDANGVSVFQALPADAEWGGAAAPAAYKIRTSMSVDALACLLRLMVQAKVVEPGVKSELFAFGSGIFKMPGTGVGGISPHSFNNKYKQVIMSTADNARLLMRMIKIAEKEYRAG